MAIDVKSLLSMWCHETSEAVWSRVCECMFAMTRPVMILNHCHTAELAMSSTKMYTNTLYSRH